MGCHSLVQGTFPTQGQTQVPCIAGGFFTFRAVREAHLFFKGAQEYFPGGP